MEDIKVLKNALEQIEQMSDPGSPETAIVRMKSIATEALQQQGNKDADGWISVEDRLPDEGERVFVYYKTFYDKYMRDIVFYTYGGVHEFDDENDDFPECLNEEKGTYFLPEGFWFNSEVDENLFQRSKVTHWRPLPSPPKAQGI